MKKPILITLLCAGLMLVTPFTTIAKEHQVSNNLTDNPDIDGLIAQIRTVVDEIFEKYGHISIIANQCGLIINLLDSVEDMIICIILIMLTIPVIILFTIFAMLKLDFLIQYMAGIAFVIGTLLDDYCFTYNKSISKLSFQSINTMLETKDNLTQSFDGCPCL